jgi:ABC-type lipoprotein release transport system permease subunit
MFRLLLKLAFKNALLRPSRTLLLVVMIAVSMSMMLAIEGLYDGMSDNMIDKNRRSESGDVSLYAKGYRLERTLDKAIADALHVKSDIEALPEVDAAIMRLHADGLAATAKKSTFATLIGINLHDEEHFGKFGDFLKKGSVSFEGHGALVGLELAKKLKLGIGSKVVFSTQDIHGEIVSAVLRVRGIMQTTNIVLDKSALFIDRTHMDALLGTSKSMATQIAVMGKSELLAQTLAARYKHLDVESFWQLQPLMAQMQQMMSIFNSVTFIIVMAVVFVGIFGVLYVSVLGRVREFGIMQAVGMHFNLIVRQILLEALILGLFGYITGALLGLFALVYLRDVGLDFSAFSDALEMWGYEAVIYGSIKSSYFTHTFLAIVLASLLSVWLPLRKIWALKPIDVIKVDK